MSAMRAIVWDTWRQSRQQVVFLLMAIAMVVVCIGTALSVGERVDEEGNTRVTVFGSEDSSSMLEGSWGALYVGSLMNEDPNVNANAATRAIFDAKLEAAEHDISLSQRGAEVVGWGVSWAFYTISMVLFIIASSGYFPGLLEGGAIDLMLSKSLERWKIYLGKYFGGLALFTVAISLAYVLLFVVVGMRTGVWLGSLFYVLPLQIFVAALLYAMIAALGVRFRSPLLSAAIGLGLYLLVDTGIGVVISAQNIGVLSGIEGVDSMLEWYSWLVPNFSLLKSHALVSVLNLPVMEWQPFITAGVWIVITLGYGYWRFARSDY